MNNFNTSTVKKIEKFMTVKNYSQNTIRNYISSIRIFISSYDKNIYHINKKDISNFFNEDNFNSISQQNLFINSIKILLKFINKEHIDIKCLKRPRKNKKLPKVIETNYLLNKINQINNLKHKAIISLSYSTGMRVSEIINLKIKDIDSNKNIINILNSKGNKDRIVPLSENILKLLRNYYKIYKPKKYLFNGQNSLQYSSGSCNKIVKKYIGSEYSPHSLRHSCFTTMLESGIDLRTIQKIAGHSNIKTTTIYTHLNSKFLSKVKTPI